MHPGCDKCKLYAQCENPFIAGRGDLTDPLLVLIGEAPGKNEDLEGKVFVGSAGIKLDNILGDKLSLVRITNGLRCCPYKNPLNRREGIRQPTDFEMECCRPFLLKELRIFNPKRVILMPMGTAAYYSLFTYPPEGGITANVGKLQEFDLDGQKYTVVPNFHPAYLLEGRHPEAEGRFIGVLERAFALAKSKREGVILREDSDWEILPPQKAIMKLQGILDNKNLLGCFYIDLETTSFEPHEAEIIMVNFSSSLDYSGYSIPLQVTNINHHLGYPYEVPIIEWNISPEEVAKIRELVSQIVQEIPLTAHHIPFDLRCFFHRGWIPNFDKIKVFDDTVILTHLIYNQKFGNLKLKNVCRKLFDVRDDWEEKVNDYINRFRLKSERTYDKIPTGVLGEYGALDAFYLKKLHNHLLEKMPKKLQHLREFMNYLTIVYSEAAIAGFPIDQVMLDYLSLTYEKMINEMKEKTHSFDEVKRYIKDKLVILQSKYVTKRIKPTEEKLEGEAFGMTKLKPLAEVMYGKKYLGMPVLKETKGGKHGDKKSPSTDQEAVDLLKHNGALTKIQREFIDNLVDFRTISKLKDTYVDPVCEEMRGGVYYWDFIIAGTVTGRLASGFHTLPHDSDIKRMYSSRWRDQGGLITSADFSQLELRILATLAQEYKMIDAFKAGIDIHAKTASEIFHIKVEDVTEEQRQLAKVVNFSIIYGKTAETLMDDLHCTRERAQEIIDSVLGGYDKVSDWMMARYREVADKASVTTIFGREIPIPEWEYESHSAHLKAFRDSVNYPIQSAASDVVKSSIARLHKKIKEVQMRTIFLGDAHDAIHCDKYPGELFSLLCLMKLSCEDEVMELYKDWLICPIKIDVSLGVSIGSEIEFEIKELEDDRVLLEGEGAKKDFNMLVAFGSEAYKMNLFVEREKPVKPEEYSLDRVIRDSVKWEAKLEIKRK